MVEQDTEVNRELLLEEEFATTRSEDIVSSSEYRCARFYGRTICRMSHVLHIHFAFQLYSCAVQLLSAIRRHADTRFARIIRPRCLPSRFSFDGRNRARLSGLTITRTCRARNAHLRRNTQRSFSPAARAKRARGCYELYMYTGGEDRYGISNIESRPV
jgi:hypothetical protein